MSIAFYEKRIDKDQLSFETKYYRKLLNEEPRANILFTIYEKKCKKLFIDFTLESY